MTKRTKGTNRTRQGPAKKLDLSVQKETLKDLRPDDATNEQARGGASMLPSKYFSRQYSSSSYIMTGITNGA